jgi:hypothetical protein
MATYRQGELFWPVPRAEVDAVGVVERSVSALLVRADGSAGASRHAVAERLCCAERAYLVALFGRTPPLDQGKWRACPYRPVREVNPL